VGGAAVQHHAGGEFRPEDARFAEQPEHLGRRPAVEGRRRGRDQHEVGREQRRTGHPGGARCAIDDHVIGIRCDGGQLAVQGFSGEAQHAEEPRQLLAGALLGPVECRALRVRIDHEHALSLTGPASGEVQGKRRFAGAAFLIEERDDHRPLLFPVTAAPVWLSLSGGRVSRIGAGAENDSAQGFAPIGLVPRL